MSNEEIEIVKENLKIFECNSPIWAFGKIFKIENNGEKKEIKTSEIFKMDKLDKKKYEFTDYFKNEMGSFKIKCRLCDFETNYHLSSKSCSPFLNHIMDYHYELLENPRRISHKKHVVFKKSDNFQDKNTHISLLLCLISTHSSFYLTENQCFQDFIGKLNDEYVIPSRETLISFIMNDVLEKIKSIVKNEISETTGICASLDGWKSKLSYFKYFSFTLHYIFGNEIKSRILKLKEFRDGSDSTEISKFIKDVVDEYNLNEFGDFIIITDNANDVSSGVINAGFHHIGCIAHLIHLVFTDVVEENVELKLTLNKFRRIENLFRNKNEFKISLKDVQDEIYKSNLVLCHVGVSKNKQLFNFN